MKLFSISIFIWFACRAYSQPNCSTFLQMGDTAQYEACKFVEAHKNDYYQFDWRQMEIWEKALSICPYFAYPYREAGVPYIKAGNPIEWKKYIDKAVEYAPIDYLPVRASLRYKFFADYEGSIKDIDEFEHMMGDPGFTSNGTYHLNIVKGLCYKGLGKIDKAIEVLEEQIQKENYHVALYDYLHLGVLYLKKEEYQKALKILHKQKEEYDFAENRYYAAMAYKALGEEEQYLINLKKAKELYLAEKRLHDPYNEMFDQIYLLDIEEELEAAEK